MSDPSLTPRVCSNLCPLRWWYCLTILSSASPFLFWLQSFPASVSFSMSRLFISGGQSIGTSASVLAVNIQGWFPLGLTVLISLLSKRLSRFFSSTAILKYQFFGAQPSLWSNSHICTRFGKTIALTVWTIVDKEMSLFFNMLSRFVIAFLSSSKCLLTSWLQSLSALILEPMKICHCFHVSPICHEGLEAMILAFVMLTCKLLSFFGFWPQGMWDFSSPTRDWTSTPCIGSLTMRPPGKPHTPQTF